MKTAVEFYREELNALVSFKESKFKTEPEIFEQAKEMEKEAHQETWDSAHQAGRFEGKGIAEENWQTFETYWEVTFKSE